MKNLRWVYLVALSLVWGSSFILMKRGLAAFSSSQVAALRISTAYIFLLPFVIYYYRIDLRKFWKGLLGMGVFGNLIPAFLFTYAETGISSSLTGMLNALTPLFTIILGWLFFGNSFNRNQFLGVVLGFCGAWILMSQGLKGGANETWPYALCVVAATLCYALSVNMIKHYLGDIDSVRATVWAFMFTGPISVIYLFNTDFFDRLNFQASSLPSLGYISILGIVGSAISVIYFNRLIKISGPVFASTTTYLIPIVAIFWGLLERETIHWTAYCGTLIILAAILIINRQGKNSPRKRGAKKSLEEEATK